MLPSQYVPGRSTSGAASGSATQRAGMPPGIVTSTPAATSVPGAPPASSYTTPRMTCVVSVGFERYIHSDDSVPGSASANGDTRFRSAVTGALLAPTSRVPRTWPPSSGSTAGTRTISFESALSTPSPRYAATANAYVAVASSTVVAYERVPSAPGAGRPAFSGAP